MGADRLLIVDGHHYAYRSFYAIRAMNAPDGFPTNALYGFINSLRRMRARVAPTHIAVIWDGGLDEDRTEALPNYKAERDPMPDDLELQLDALDEWLGAAGVHSWCHEGVEADDGIGTLTRQAEAAGLPVVVASSDKDFFQLINPNVHLLNPNDKTDTLWQAEQVRAKTGVEPAQIIDWLSLVGDTVDGIPGVRGVGPKTATKLLAEYGTAKNLYANLDAVKPDGLRARLGDAAEEVRRNQELVALKEISEWQIQLDDLRPGAGDYATLHAQYTRWNFRSLLNELESGRQGVFL